jgi:AcrR family transcriptional regulator
MISLTIEKGFNAVTVTDISERAMVNRATFYRYYQDKYDLLDQYTEKFYTMQSAYNETIAPADRRVYAPDEPPEGLVRVWEEIRANAAFFRVMLGPKGDPGFTQKARDYIEKRVGSNLPDLAAEAPNLPLALCLSYISSASIGLILWWLENDMPYSPRQMAVWSLKLSNADLAAVLSSSMLPERS